jgi:hypothetical protein
MNKEKNIPNGYPIYDTVYGSEIPTEQYYVIKFDSLPSKYIDNISYDPSVAKFLEDKGFNLIQEIYTTNRRYDQSNQTLYVNETLKMLVRVYGSTDKSKNNLVHLDILYDVRNGELKKQIWNDELKEYVRKKKKSNINLVKSDMGHLDTEEYDLFVPPMDLELNYGNDFNKVHDVIIQRLNKPHDKGIILLHGDPGTGKTSYIKHLTSLISDKDILFIPPSMAEMLSEPSIIPFLMDHKNSILIIEDAERVIGDREGNGSPAGVSNILNLTDGILGDCLNIQIVATFNMKREKIDKALLRKGRLIAEHKFEKLSIEDTNNLLKSLGKEPIAEESMCLADIYNIDVELIKTSNKTSKIGF